MPVEHLERLAVGMQGLALTTCEAPRSQDRLDLVHLVHFGDRRKAQDFPLLLRENMADQVVLVQPLHDDNDGAVPLVVESAVESMDEPLVAGLPLCVRERLIRLQRVVNQNYVGAATGEHTTGRGGEPVALAGGDELLHRLAVRRQAGREELTIPRAHHDAAAIAGELIGELLGIADAEDLRRGVVPETPGRKSDRGHQRFEVTRRQVDDQPPDPALPHGGQLGGDDLEVPVGRQAGLGVEVLEAAPGEGRQVVPQQELVLRPGQILHYSDFPIEKRALICSRTFSSASLKSEVSGAVGSV